MSHVSAVFPSYGPTVPGPGTTVYHVIGPSFGGAVSSVATVVLSLDTLGLFISWVGTLLVNFLVHTGVLIVTGIFAVTVSRTFPPAGPV